jgi:hypothetical protein
VCERAVPCRTSRGTSECSAASGQQQQLKSCPRSSMAATVSQHWTHMQWVVRPVMLQRDMKAAAGTAVLMLQQWQSLNMQHMLDQASSDWMAAPDSPLHSPGCAATKQPYMQLQHPVCSWPMLQLQLQLLPSAAARCQGSCCSVHGKQFTRQPEVLCHLIVCTFGDTNICAG